MDELNFAVARLKSNKAPGPDGLPSELYKWLDEDNRTTLLRHLLRHLNKCWDTEMLEVCMTDVNLATICKNGPTDRPENYRPIALLHITYKIPAIITHVVRLCESHDDIINSAQFGFRKKKGTAQPLFIYRRLQEIQEESGSSFHTLLLDWEKAFDKVDQARMIQAIRRLGIKEK